MYKEEKELLLQDMCARLPYGVYLHYKGEFGEEQEPMKMHELNRVMVNAHYELEGCTPYLRPMSSMTEEEKKKYKRLCINAAICNDYQQVDYLNSRYLDYRGLIPKGLALEAPEDMYKFD